MFENMTGYAEGHLRIIDKATEEVLVDQKNAIHFGNISWAIASALAGSELGHISHMVLGSGGTSIDSAGNISYRSPNTSNLQDPAAEPYQPTYWQDLSATGNTIETVPGTSNFADLKTVTTLSFGEPDNVSPEFLQESTDTAATTNGTYVFDEIAMYTGTTMGDLAPFSFAPDGRMVTHVIFHPVQKSANRELQLEYTIRVQMGP